MSFELFEQGPGVYVPVLIGALLLTIVQYGAFPIGFALFRQEDIEEKR